MDATASQRQNRRVERLKSEGITRSTVLVHDKCRPALDSLKLHLKNPEKAEALTSLVEQLQIKTKPTNVSQVKHLSPFRYPGGKTWLVPEVRRWLKASEQRPSVFVEPFAGGAIAGLSMAAEGLTDRVYLCELDDDVWDESMAKGEVCQHCQNVRSLKKQRVKAGSDLGQIRGAITRVGRRLAADTTTIQEQDQ